MELSEQQSNALKSVLEWYKSKSRKQIFRVFGYAGTGKTTIAKEFAAAIGGNVLYASYTGKAALVMRKNGCHGAVTLHSLLYKPVVDKDGVVHFTYNANSNLADARLLIVDECSMVNEDLAKDIMSFGVPILVLGDPMQLPPIEGAGYFTEATPDVMLTEIHRQAKDNPIVYLATRARNGYDIKPGIYDGSKVVSSITMRELLEADQVIVGRNATRDTVNKRFRLEKGFEGLLPVVGDRLICLKNDKDVGIFNGELFNVKSTIKSKRYGFHDYRLVDISNENKVIAATAHDYLFDHSPEPNWKYLKFSQKFDYGYGITCHKSQGSQWENVVIFNESWCFRETAHRWLYTAITRAQENVTIYDRETR